MHGPILFVINAVNESTSPYNEHVLHWKEKKTRRIHVCHFLKPTIEVPENLVRYSGNGNLWTFLKRIRTALSSTRFSVFHVHAPLAGFIFCLYCHFFSRTSLKRSVYTVHTSYSNFRPHHKLMAALIFVSLGRIVCCSHSSLKSLPNWLRLLAGSRLSVVQNGVDLERICKTADTVQKNPAYTQFAFVGRLETLKHPETILKAFSIYTKNNNQKAKLILIGDGSMKLPLTEMAHAHGLEEAVSFHGKLPRSKVFKLLYESHFYISASRVEGFPVAVLESMACGCTPILSHIPPHQELVQSLPEHIDISLFPVRDYKSLAKIMEDKSALTIDCREEQSEALYKHIEKHLSLSAMIEQYNQIYTDIGSDY